MTLETNFSNGTVADADDVNTNFDLCPMKIASGTITLNEDQTAYDNDYADISVSAGDLTANDMIIIELIGNNGSDGDALKVKFDISGTTATGAIGESPDFAHSDIVCVHAVITQDINTNDIIRGNHMTDRAGGTIAGFGGSLDTNDANILTTAFTIRINLKYLTANGAGDSSFRYIAYALRG